MSDNLPCPNCEQRGGLKISDYGVYCTACRVTSWPQCMCAICDKDKDDSCPCEYEEVRQHWLHCVESERLRKENEGI